MPQSTYCSMDSVSSMQAKRKAEARWLVSLSAIRLTMSLAAELSFLCQTCSVITLLNFSTVSTVEHADHTSSEHLPATLYNTLLHLFTLLAVYTMYIPRDLMSSAYVLYRMLHHILYTHRFLGVSCVATLLATLYLLSRVIVGQFHLPQL
jgi:hypothetical protein